MEGTHWAERIEPSEKYELWLHSKIILIFEILKVVGSVTFSFHYVNISCINFHTCWEQCSVCKEGFTLEAERCHGQLSPLCYFPLGKSSIGFGKSEQDNQQCREESKQASKKNIPHGICSYGKIKVEIASLSLSLFSILEWLTNA